MSRKFSNSDLGLTGREHLSIAEVSQILGCCRKFLHLACKNGQIPGAWRMGRHWRIPVKGLRAFIEERTIQPERRSSVAPGGAPRQVRNDSVLAELAAKLERRRIMM